jgi:hypothetical protein
MFLLDTPVKVPSAQCFHSMRKQGVWCGPPPNVLPWRYPWNAQILCPKKAAAPRDPVCHELLNSPAAYEPPQHHAQSLACYKTLIHSKLRCTRRSLGGGPCCHIERSLLLPLLTVLRHRSANRRHDNGMCDSTYWCVNTMPLPRFTPWKLCMKPLRSP